MPVTIKTGVGGGSVTLDSGTGVLDTTLTLPNINGTVLYSDANGNVGIGTSSPAAKFVVNSGLSLFQTNTNDGYNIIQTSSSFGMAGGVGYYSELNQNLYYNSGWKSRNGGPGAQINLQGGSASGYTSAIRFLVDNNPTSTAANAASNITEAMRIDANGNLGIGTTSPQAKLNTSGAGIVEQLNSSTSFAAKLFVSSTTTGLGRFIAAEANDMTFGRYGVAEHMRIDSSGNFLVGTTSGGYRFHVKGGGADTVNISNDTFSSGSYFIRFGVGSGTGTNIGYISYNGSGVTYSTTSDYRLKHSVTPMTTGLAAVAALKPVTYKWNADNSDGEGFIAHELQSVIPFAVTGDKDAVDEEGNIKPQGVDYSKIVVHLVAAIQELSAKNDALESRLAALENK